MVDRWTYQSLIGQALKRFKAVADSLECERDECNGFDCIVHADQNLALVALECFEIRRGPLHRLLQSCQRQLDLTRAAIGWTTDDQIDETSQLYFEVMKRLNTKLYRIGSRAPTIREAAELYHLRGLAEIHKNNLYFWKAHKVREHGEVR